MDLSFFRFLILFVLKAPEICESRETVGGELLDLGNPIDLMGFGLRHNLAPSAVELSSIDGSPVVLLYDDLRDDLRRKEGVDIKHKARQSKRVVFRDDSLDPRWLGIIRNSRLNLERQREIDRRKHLRENFEGDLRNPANLVNSRIKLEREDEIRREVEKALDKKEKIFEDIIFEKRKGFNPYRERLMDQRNQLPSNTFSKRIGPFDSSLERREMERRNRLSLNGNDRRRPTKRNAPTPNRRIAMEELRWQNYEDTNRRREQEKLNHIENQRRTEILNEKRSGILAEIKRQHEFPLKPPILIYEEVRVPVPVKVYDDHHNNDEFSTEKDFDRGSSQYIDRRPERPNENDGYDDVTYLGEGVLLEDLPSILPISVTSDPIAHVDPSLEANIALTANLAAVASDLENLNQAATIADINILHHLQLQEAATLATINDINQAVLNTELQDTLVNDDQNSLLSANQHILLSQALLDQHLIDAATDEQLSQAQKVDFINLVLKDGLKEALRKQLKLHLKNKAEEDAFIQTLHVTREDLIKRLILLKPFFWSSNTGSFILPDFIPDIPIGFIPGSDDLESLPQIYLQPSTSLLPSDFRIPSDISHDIEDDLDIAFVEHVLRLPEHVFQKVIHLPKKDFILTLFPTLFRESLREFKYDPIKHYHPNLPHKGIVKEHHIHHHVYTPPAEKVPVSEEPQSSFKETGYPIRGPPEEEHHIHHLPPKFPPTEPVVETHSQHPFEQVLAQHPPESHQEVHIVRHPVQHGENPWPKRPLQGHVDHPRLTIPQGSVSFEEPPLSLDSSYIAYQGEEPSFDAEPVEPVLFHPREPIYPPLISPHPVRGINVRHKGYKLPTITSPDATGISIRVFDGSLEGRTGSIEIPHSRGKFRLRKITKDKFKSAVPLEDKSFQNTDSLPSETEEINSSTLKPKPISVAEESKELSRVEGTTNDTFTKLPRPVTISSIDALSLLPALSTANSIPGDRDKEDQAINFSTGIESSTVSPPALATFGGFSGNIRQKTIAERNKENDEAENHFNNIFGLNDNDDEHVLSFFQKKTGNNTETLKINNSRELNENGSHLQANSTEEIVGKVKSITNIFGTRLQETIPEIHFERANRTSLAFSPFFLGHRSDANDSIEPSTRIGSTSTSLRPVFQQGHFQTQIEPQREIGSGILGAKFPDEVKKKIPTPRKLDTFGSVFHLQRKGFPNKGFRGSIPEAGLSPGQNFIPKTFAGIQVNGLENLPKYLRKAPPCTLTPSGNRSFCIYPENYDSKVASEIVQRYGKEIKELKSILKQIPRLGPDLTEASKQLPNLNISVSCEDERRQVKLSWSRDILGSWLLLLQTDPFEQQVVITTCADSARVKGCRPLLQPNPFIAFHPSDVTPKPYIMEFPLPVACVYAAP